MCASSYPSCVLECLEPVGVNLEPVFVGSEQEAEPFCVVVWQFSLPSPFVVGALAGYLVGGAVWWAGLSGNGKQNSFVYQELCPA